MNLLFRLAWTWIARPWRAPVPPLGPCVTRFRVLPTDLDVLLHVNNGVYLSMMDVARMDLMVRSGVLQLLSARGWHPVVAGVSIKFRRSLQPFERFTIETRVIGWDERAMLLEQKFVRRDEEVATAFVRSAFLARDGGKVAPAEVATLAGLPPASPELPDATARWNADQAGRRPTS